MRILAIETSCDETAIAIVDAEGEGKETVFRVLADKTLTQIDIHKEYGGVFPMLAKREHARAIIPLLVKTLEQAKLYRKTSRHVIESPLRTEFQEILEHEPELFARFVEEVPEIDPPEIDAIAVTKGPGLEPALWVGINCAKALSMIWKKPVIAVNHMEGHLLLPLFSPEENELHGRDIEFPLVGLLVSGGHTELVVMRDWGNYELLGETKDDAVGEAFDKVARMLSLPYPGGPEISRLAEKGRPGIYPLPRPMIGTDDYAFSFAGLKTAVLYLVKKLGGEKMLSEEQKADIAREFEDACVDVLLRKTLKAMKETGATGVIVGGGVSANTRLRNTLLEGVSALGGKVYLPSKGHSTDNALMIAVAAYFGKEERANEMKAEGNWKLSG